jgi:hypothetical protein
MEGESAQGTSFRLRTGKQSKRIKNGDVKEDLAGKQIVQPEIRDYMFLFNLQRVAVHAVVLRINKHANHVPEIETDGFHALIGDPRQTSKLCA